MVGELVGQHHHAGADLELGVADVLRGVTGHAHALGGTEHVLVELDGVGRTATAQVRRDARVALGNRMHGHGDLQGVETWRQGTT